jgi:DNA-directed RNA polymerase specialized sigma24 family protein
MDASLASATPDVLATHARFVRALARELLADPHAADDVAQEAWTHKLNLLRR